MMNSIVRALAVGIIALIAFGEIHSAEKYNLISIVTDDQARWAVGAYGNKECITPNMDRLAREGATFLNAFVPSPVCSPSRASFMTGRYGTEVGITDWLSPGIPQQIANGLPSELTTWPEVLQKHGYRTALVGKWHLGIKPEYHPTRHGFDHFFGFTAGGQRPIDPMLEKDGKVQQFKGPLPDLLTDDAIQFVESNTNRPFALSLHFRAPHTPYAPVPEKDSQPFADLDPTIPNYRGAKVSQVKNWTREYYASIHSVDRNIGRLLNRLDDLKLTGNTIVMFTSDHGYMVGHHTMHTKGNGWWMAGGVRGPKRPNMFEESIRIPLIVRWPGVIKPETKIHEMISAVDTFPSVLGMLGLPVPENASHHGMDFSTLLRGETAQWRDTIFGQYDLHNGGLAYMRMIRTDRWKLVRHLRTFFMDELYDLKNDPGERRNLYHRAGHQPTIQKLNTELVNWMESINDPLLADARR